jgi:Cft2 family RNA processing exonuclease
MSAVVILDANPYLFTRRGPSIEKLLTVVRDLEIMGHTIALAAISKPIIDKLSEEDRSKLSQIPNLKVFSDRTEQEREMLRLATEHPDWKIVSLDSFSEWKKEFEVVKCPDRFLRISPEPKGRVILDGSGIPSLSILLSICRALMGGGHVVMYTVLSSQDLKRMAGEGDITNIPGLRAFPSRTAARNWICGILNRHKKLILVSSDPYWSKVQGISARLIPASQVASEVAEAIAEQKLPFVFTALERRWGRELTKEELLGVFAPMDSNPSSLIDAAVKRGWLSPSGEGKWRVTALPLPLVSGEDVQALSQQVVSDFLREVNAEDFLFMALGGGHEIGRSCYLLKFCGKFFVLDCGIAMRAEPWRRYPSLELLGTIRDRIAGVFITHAHYDHCAALLYLSTLLPNIPIYCTPKTADALEFILEDSINVAAKSMCTEPFLSSQIKSLLNIVPVEVGKEVKMGDVTVRVLDAGHVPGSCSFLFEGPEGKVLYTGDIGPGGTRLSGEPQPEKADIVICEGTYLNQPLHPPREQEEERLAKAITETVKRKGKILIPAFAVGRAQEMKALLEELRAKKKIPDVPIRLYGLAEMISDVVLQSGEEEGGTEERTLQEEVEDEKPAVIVASSGMLRGGASSYLIQFIGQDPKSLCAIVGHQDEESPGRELLEKKMRGEKPLPCEVEGFGFSAHADEEGLEKYILSCQPKLVIFIHREYARGKLIEKLKGRGIRVSAPTNLQAVKKDGTLGASFPWYWGILQEVKGQFVCVDCRVRFSTLRDVMVHGYNHPTHRTLYFRRQGPVHLYLFSSPRSRTLQMEFTLLDALLPAEVLQWGTARGNSYYLVLASLQEIRDEIESWMSELVNRYPGLAASLTLQEDVVRVRKAPTQFPTRAPKAEEAPTPNLEQMAREEYERVREFLGKRGKKLGPPPPFKVSLDPYAWAFEHFEQKRLAGSAARDKDGSVRLWVSPEQLRDPNRLRGTMDHELAHYVQFKLGKPVEEEVPPDLAKEFAEGFATWVQYRLGGGTAPLPERDVEGGCYVRGLVRFLVMEEVFGKGEVLRIGLEEGPKRYEEMADRAMEKIDPDRLWRIFSELSLLKPEEIVSQLLPAESEGGGKPKERAEKRSGKSK